MSYHGGMGASFDIGGSVKLGPTGFDVTGTAEADKDTKTKTTETDKVAVGPTQVTQVYKPPVVKPEAEKPFSVVVGWRWCRRSFDCWWDCVRNDAEVTR